MNFIPRFLPCNTECKQGSSALRSFVRSAPLRYLIFQNSELVELPARGRRRPFALPRAGWRRLSALEPPFLARAEGPRGQQSLEIILAGACAAPRALRLGAAE